MSPFASILLLLDRSPDAAKGIGCALWLAEALGATLHVLQATTPATARENLAQLPIPETQRKHVVVHPFSGDAEIAVIEAIAARGVDLVVLSARGEMAPASAETLGLGGVAQAVIERSPVPVLLLPARYRESLPWTSIVVAASGEAPADKALETAARLAATLQLRVRVVHSEYGADTAALGAFTDSPHHEVTGRLAGMVHRGLACCTPDEAQCVDPVLFARGEPAAVLLEQVERFGSSVLALGWHGALGAGRAPVLKQLVERADCALLLVRRAERSTAHLKVGREIDDD